MTLSDIRDYIETLTQGAVYIGPIPDKPEKIVGVYNSKHQHEYKVAIGGPQLESYGTKYVTLLVHWNKSQRETEKAGKALFEAVRATRNATVNHETIKFVLPVYDLQDIGVDDSGIYEMVIELAVIFEKIRKRLHSLQYFSVKQCRLMLCLSGTGSRSMDIRQTWNLRTAEGSSQFYSSSLFPFFSKITASSITIS